MGCFVSYQRVVVDALGTAADGASVEGDFGVFALQIDVAEVARLSACQGDAVVLD